MTDEIKKMQIKAWYWWLRENNYECLYFSLF